MFEFIMETFTATSTKATCGQLFTCDKPGLITDPKKSTMAYRPITLKANRRITDIQLKQQMYDYQDFTI